jgi:hypothetical protein
MKQTHRAFFVVFMLTAVLLSACGAGAVQGASSKVEADVIFTGVIESIEGAQWTVNGRTFTVDPSVVRDGPFVVGDTVKVEGAVQADGTVLATRVELPAAFINGNDANTNDVNVNDANVNDDNSNNANVNDANSNDDNSNDTNTNDDNSNDSDTNDDNSNDTTGNGNSNDDDSDEDNTNDDDSQGDSGSNDNGGDDNSNGG